MFMAVIKQADSKDYGRTSFISCPATIPLPPDQGKTSYISPPATIPQPPDHGRTSYISHPDKIHSPLLQHLLITDYGRTSYSKTILPFFGPNLAPISS